MVLESFVIKNISFRISPSTCDTRRACSSKTPRTIREERSVRTRRIEIKSCYFRRTKDECV